MNLNTYIRLSAFYFFFFAAVGAFVPYWSLYLSTIGFSATEISELMAAVAITRIISPNLWGWFTDRHASQRLKLIQLASFITLLVFSLLFFTKAYWWLFVILSLYSFFWNALLPQYEVHTLALLGRNTQTYSRLRLWGSIGFIIMAVGLGRAFELWPPELLLFFLGALLLGLWLSCMATPPVESYGEHKQGEGSFFQVLKRPEVIALFVITFLQQGSHGPYYTFYTLYLEDQGHARDFIGWLWGLGVIAEIFIFIYMHRLLPRFGARKLLLFTLAVTSFRWFMIGHFSDSIALLIFYQLFHAASFGIFHAVSIHLLHDMFSSKHKGQGMALYSSLGYGAGVAFGTLVSGYIWDGISPAAIFDFAAIMPALGFVIAWFWIKENDNKKSQT